MILKSFYIFWLHLCMHGGGANPVTSYRSDTQWTQCGYRSLDGLSNIWTIALQNCHVSLATHCNYNILTIMCMSFIRWQYSLQWVMKQNWHRQNGQLFKGSFTQLPPFTIPTIFMTITVIPHFSVYIDDSQPNDCFTSTRGCTHEHMYTFNDLVEAHATVQSKEVISF